MNERPIVSIIMPVYNAAEFLNDSVGDIIAQTYGDFEFIIVDNCSRDASGIIADEYALKDKIVLLPRVINDKMIFIKINNDTKYEKSPFGVKEPIGEEYLGDIDLIIVPGVAFDKKNNRLYRRTLFCFINFSLLY